MYANPHVCCCRGYAYAIATTSFTMMTYLASQCDGNSCGFTIPYPKAVPGA